MLHKVLATALAVAAMGCGTSDPGTLGVGGNGAGGGGGVNIKLDAGKAGSGGAGGNGTAVAGSGQLILVVRDFRLYSSGDSKTNSDFENYPKVDQNGNPSTTYAGDLNDREIVTDTLGDDYKPVYKNTSGKTLTTHGKASFDQWYRTVEGTNILREIPITLTKNSKGLFEYDSRYAGAPLSPGGSFFPIDDGSQYKTAFGNEGKNHNYSFTVEIHTLFTYNGGETFSFSGDDDVFVYIDKKLVINLGGIHGREEQSVNIDSLGLTPGWTYPLDFFSAERHVVESNLWITTSLALTTNTEIPIF